MTPQYKKMTLHNKHKGSDFSKALQGTQKTGVSYSSSISPADATIGDDRVIVFVTSNDLKLKYSECQEKAETLKNQAERKDITIFFFIEATAATRREFLRLQQLIVAEMGLNVIPISRDDQVVSCLLQMARFKNTFSPREHSQAATTSLESLPGIGTMLATSLLNEHESLTGILMASTEQLTTSIGSLKAHKLRKLLDT